MDNRLKQILNNHSSKFGDWIEKLNKHNQSYSLDSEYTQEEKINFHLAAANVLGDISNLFFEYGAFKDTFDNGMMYGTFDGPCVIIKSAKMDHTFYIGIGSEGIYLRSFLKHAENLRHMDDSFYKDIFSLQNIGQFELAQDQFYSRGTTAKYPDLFSNNKSILFKLLRNYFVGTVEKESDILLGDIQILWTYDTDFYDLVSNSCLAFKTIYKLNYSLWKIYDLQTKKNNTSYPRI